MEKIYFSDFDFNEFNANDEHKANFNFSEKSIPGS